MDINKIKKYFNKNETAMNEGLEKRINSDELTANDIMFIQKHMNFTVLSGLSIDLSLLVPTFTEAAMRLQELKNEGESEVDLDYALTLVNDITNFFVDLKEKLSDIGMESPFIEV